MAERGQSRASGRPGLWTEVWAMIGLAAPIMVAQGGLVGMGLVDTFMIGRVSSVEMGGVALGNIVVLVVVVFGLGLTMGIEPLATQAIGANEPQRAYGWYQQGLWAALASSVPLSVLLVVAVALLPYLGVKASVIGATAPYIWLRLPSVPVNAMYGAARSYLTSIRRTRPIVVAVLSANVANVGLNYLFVFEFGMGAAGVGLATSICWTLMFAIAGWGAYLGRPAGSGGLARPDGGRLIQIFRLGWPIGLQLTFEVGIFGLVGLLVAQLGEVPLAAHQIAMTLASFTFMAAVGIAVASTTMVGHRIGAGDTQGARRIGTISIVLGGLFMASGGVVFYALPEALARLFSPTDEAVVQLGAQLLMIAALFSASDGIQVVSAGALRGAGDTKWAFYANAVGHWLLGVPLGLYMAWAAGFGVRGLWFGLTAGLTVVAVVLTVRFWLLTARPIERAE